MAWQWLIGLLWLGWVVGGGQGNATLLRALDPPQQDTVNFGAVPVHLSRLDAVVLRNSTDKVQQLFLYVSTSSPGFYLANPNDTAVVLLPKSEYLVILVFSPEQTGVARAALRILHVVDSTSYWSSVSLVGKGVAPDAELEHLSYPRAVFAGETPVGTMVRTVLTIASNLPVERRFTIYPGDSSGVFAIIRQDSLLPPWGARQVVLSFAPHSKGYHKGYLYFRIARSPTVERILVFGKGTEQAMPHPVRLQYPHLVDFGAVPRHQWRDSSIAIVNQQDTAVWITAMRIDHPVFHRIAPLEDSVQLAPGDTLQLRLRFAPEDTTFYEASLSLGVGKYSYATIRLVGEGISQRTTAIVGTAKLQAAVGDTVVLPVWIGLDSVGREVLQLLPEPKVVLALHWNATVLWSLDTTAVIVRHGHVEYGRFEIPIAKITKWQLDTIAHLPFVVCLGDMLGTWVEIDSAWVEDQQQQRVFAFSLFDPGYIAILGVWHHQHIPRLLNPFAVPFTVHLEPSPLRTQSMLRIAGDFNPAELHIALYQLSGELLFPLPVMQSSPPVTLILRRSDFPGPGVYVVVCQYQATAYARFLIVE